MKPKRIRPALSAAEMQIFAQTQAAFQVLVSEATSRANLQNRLGKSYDDNRDVYTALGYPKVIRYDDYLAKYARMGIAKRIVEALPDATWREEPNVFETESEDLTPFEIAWNEMVTKKKIYHYLRRVDRLAGVGQFAVLFLGLDDGNTNLKQPLGRATEILYFSVYGEGRAVPSELNSDIKNPLFGLPEIYKINTISPDENGVATQKFATNPEIEVHHSRVIHVADSTSESDVYGTPRLQCVFNELLNLEIVAGGAAEAFWRGGFPGYNFKMDPTVQLAPAQTTDMEDEIEEYVHKFKRYVLLKGITVEPIQAQVTDPSPFISTIMTQIASATGIPQRILSGAENGKMSSNQDESSWNDRIEERRKNFAEDIILRPFINKMIESGVLPTPSDFTISWPSMDTMDETEKIKMAERKARALALYSKDPKAQEFVPPRFFLEDVMGFSKTRVEAMQKESVPAPPIEKGVGDAERNV